MRIFNELGLPYEPEVTLPTKTNLEKILRIISQPSEEFYDLQLNAFSNDPSYLNALYNVFYELEEDLDY